MPLSCRKGPTFLVKRVLSKSYLCVCMMLHFFVVVNKTWSLTQNLADPRTFEMLFASQYLMHYNIQAQICKIRETDSRKSCVHYPAFYCVVL